MGPVLELKSTIGKVRSSASKDSTPLPALPALGPSDTSALWGNMWVVGLGDRWPGKVTPDLFLVTCDIELAFEGAKGTLPGKGTIESLSI